jgi:hypothetical protein
VSALELASVSALELASVLVKCSKSPEDHPFLGFYGIKAYCGEKCSKSPEDHPFLGFYGIKES